MLNNTCNLATCCSHWAHFPAHIVHFAWKINWKASVTHMLPIIWFEWNLWERSWMSSALSYFSFELLKLHVWFYWFRLSRSKSRCRLLLLFWFSNVWIGLVLVVHHFQTLSFFRFWSSSSPDNWFLTILKFRLRDINQTWSESGCWSPW